MRLPIFLFCLVLTACNVAPPPPDEGEAAAKVDEAAKAPPRAENTQLRDAINAPLDRAKSANDPNVKSDADREQAIKDAGG